MAFKNIMSVSGGKDSTAMMTLSIERDMECRYVFADTGNEHEDTLEYLVYLEQFFGIKIERYKADFTKKIEIKKQRLINHLIALSDCGKPRRQLKHFTGSMLERIIDNLNPTGNPFLDLCMLKGRFPSRKAQFCTQELKRELLDDKVMLPLIGENHKPISWQGVRADESFNRRHLTISEKSELGYIYRPIIDWNVEMVFAQHKKHGVKPNPLYSKGMSRVGCMPCINENKKGLTSIALEAPQHIDKIENWEQIIATTSKRGKATLFQVSDVPGWPTDLESIDIKKHGIRQRVEYAKTGRGGRQQDWLNQTAEPGLCNSIYGLCE